MKFEYKYLVLDSDRNQEDAILFDSEWDKNYPEQIAQDAADYEFYNYCGWELSWPIKIQLWDNLDIDIGIFEVDYEQIPRFWAKEVEKAK